MSDDEVFDAALRLDSLEKQCDLVATLCNNDQQQAERVCELLQAHHRLITNPDPSSGSLLDRASEIFQAFSGGTDVGVGQQVGNYVLCRLIGEGATSLVYQASPLATTDRQVAIKLLKAGMDSGRVLARFALEHQVLQRLEHSGIIRILDAGIQENGRPFFAMELVSNPLTITKYASEFSLNLRQRIQLMITVCEIVQHAHQRGIIHRDLKPSNILLEGKAQQNPAPKIIDFGIAKIVSPEGSDSQSFTTLGERFGTPAYMSPEQALMPVKHVDIRSDVYSLGIILYELITGQTPRSDTTTTGSESSWTCSDYWDHPIPLPSKQLKLTFSENKSHNCHPRDVQFELDAITHKALARELELRYQSVADFQRDLQRYLAGQPVEAAGPSWLYRMRKLISRNRVAAALGTLFLLTVVSTSIVTSYYAVRAHMAEQQATKRFDEVVKAQQELTLQRDNAEQARWQAQALLRIFQVRTIMDKSLSKYLAKVVEAIAVNGQPPSPLSAEQVDIDSLLHPHVRLIVRGDWRWAKSNLYPELVNASLQLTSKQTAQAAALASPPEPVTSPTQPDLPPARPQTAQLDSSVDRLGRDLFQRIMLEEMRSVLPGSDPFIAEVLDNCGLEAQDNQQLDKAELYLRESVQLWVKTRQHPANLAQSQLFLADTLLRKGEKSPAAQVLHEARLTLDRLNENDSNRQGLERFYKELHSSVLIKAE